MPPKTFLTSGTPSSFIALKKTNAAMSTLKIAPMSAASMTFMPTQSPASASRVQRVSAGIAGELPATRPSAKKSMPMAICCDATPQHAVEKKSELNAAASPPNVAASGDNFICPKQNHAPTPRIHSAIGARNFEYPTGPMPQRVNVCDAQWIGTDRLDADAIQVIPRRFKTIWQMRNHAEFCIPNGPSLEKWTKPGKKLRQNKTASTINRSKGANHPRFLGASGADFIFFVAIFIG